MSRIHLELCELLMNEYYGEQVAQVGTFLLKKPACTLGMISQKTSIDIKQVGSHYEYYVDLRSTSLIIVLFPLKKSIWS